MTTDDEEADDQPGWPPVGEVTARVPFDRLDYGDAEQRAELTDVDPSAAEEPLELVDEPVGTPPPYDRSHKRRNQRRLPG
ncbi:hypothetical protein ACFO0M_09650 [Micromonospora mangrovi]|uniref:Uncharacterized protein n=2 Tax=Micromonospora TaxID=1873 RepID=A0AAU7M6I3_9ACTN